MNRVLLTGNLTNDFVKRSEKLATCSIAVNKEFNKGVEYLDLVAFNTTVEAVSNLKKGTLVFVEGSITSQKVNEKKYTQIVISKIDVLKAPHQEVIQDTLDDLPQGDVADDDIPF